jgi:hypothetical protein
MMPEVELRDYSTRNGEEGGKEPGKAFKYGLLREEGTRRDRMRASASSISIGAGICWKRVGGTWGSWGIAEARIWRSLVRSRASWTRLRPNVHRPSSTLSAVNGVRR